RAAENGGRSRLGSGRGVPAGRLCREARRGTRHSIRRERLRDQMTQRSAFVLRVRPDKIEEYVEAHRTVWPDMLQALSESGIRNYTIFRDGNQVFGYFE